MNLSEPGKTEEEQVLTSSAGLSESETDAAEANNAEGVEEAADAAVSDGDDAPATGQDNDEDAGNDEPVAEEESATEEAEPEAEEEEAEDPNALRRGMLLDGTISRTTPTAVYVDLGEEREGVVPGRELELMSRTMLEEMTEGADVTVYVVNPRNHRGEILLSINHALEETDWREAESYRASKEVYEGRIGGYNKGGLIVRFGRLRGFVPQSQIADTRYRLMKGKTPEERYGKFVNDEINVKVMEVDRSRNRLILSERAAMREVRQQRKEALIGELEVGEIRTGTVVSLENFGAFVDVGGAEGLVHLTELSWKHITHPRQALSVGDEVDVKIINIDPDQNRIGLSIKQIQPDPWDEIAALYANGVLVKGSVTKLTKFGAFARIHGEISVEGLIHISELSNSRVEHPRDVVKRGDTLTLRVVKVDVKNRRLGLSLKRVNSAEYLDSDMDRAFIEAAQIMDRREEEAAQRAEAEARAAAEAEMAAEAEAAEEAVADAGEAVAGSAEDAVESAEEAVEAVEDTVEDAVESAEEAVETAEESAEDAVEVAGDVAEEAVEAVEDTVEDAVESAEEAVETAVEEAEESAEEAVETAVEEATEDAQNAVEKVADTAGEAVEDVAEGAVETAQNVAETAVEAAGDAVETVTDAVSDAVEAVTGSDEDEGESSDDD